MFDLYKKRDFSAYFSDTIAFFRSFGKHYFKNYFTINGIFLLILVVLIYFISKIYMETIFSSIGNQNGNADYLLSYFNENAFLIIGVFLFFVLLLVLLSLLNITYPIVYLQLIEKTGGAKFSINEIITGIKENIGRLFLFFIGSIFVITPILILLFGILVLLCFIIIGIPLFFIAIPSVISWLSLSYYEFIIKKVSFFTALGNGFQLVKQDFWTTIGTTFLMAMLLQIIQGFITMIPYVIGVAYMLVSTQNTNNENNNLQNSGVSVLFAAIMVLSILMSYFFNNFQLVNQGLIYYSLREQNENNSTKSQIDLIGTEIE
jgi:hypothetical protein